MEALVSYLVASSMVKSPENARFSLKLKKLIAEHPDQEKLKSKKIMGPCNRLMKYLFIELSILKRLSINQYEKKFRSVNYLQDAQPESTRKTLAFSEAILSE
ncbi:hypothetical protein Tco_1362810 [Tanacetum coccineum]